MSRAEDVLAQIVAEPDDDRPRLVYADLLQQQDDPRGELIVVQCALARHAATNDDVGPLRPLEDRERALLKTYGKVWTADVEAVLRTWGELGFRRGFIESLTCNGGYQSAVDRVRAQAPLLRALSVLELDDLAASPALTGIEEITIRGEHPTVRELDALATSPHSRALRRLGFVYGNPSEREAFTFVAYPRPLDELAMGFHGEPFYGRLLLERLAKTPVRAGLRALRIRWLRRLGIITELGAALPQLETLQLENADLKTEEAHALATSFPKLVTLDLGDNERASAIDPAHLLATLPALRRLRLSKLGLTDAHAIAIARSPDAMRLVYLDLTSNKITDAGALALAHSPYLNNLRRLNLDANAIGDDARQSIARSPHLTYAQVHV